MGVDDGQCQPHAKTYREHTLLPQLLVHVVLQQQTRATSSERVEGVGEDKCSSQGRRVRFGVGEDRQQ